MRFYPRAETRQSPDAAAGTIVLSGRNLSEDDFYQDMQLPPEAHGLDLSRNRLKYIPDQIFSLSRLTILDLSRNSLRGFPSEIGRLTNLIKLIAISNHLRLRQLPLKELTSLGQLQLLDLRYNGKLKQAASVAIHDALRPNNPGLEIRCTLPSPMSQDRDSEKKLSACDRDATLLRSQLEPLSTPQLRKRLERSFGVFPDEVTEQAYDREHLVGALLRCYGKRGPRRVRREGGVPVARDRLAALRAELDAVHWPTTTRERPKIRAERYMILQKPGSGKSDSARTKKENSKLMKYKRLFDLAVETLGDIDSAFAKEFTALAVTKNFGKSHQGLQLLLDFTLHLLHFPPVGSPHIDTLNVGPFYGLSL